MGNGVEGQGSVRFGLSNNLDALDATGVALQSHRPDSELGHFVTITATALGEPPLRRVPVPEPTTTALLALSLFGPGMAARRRQVH